MQPNNLFYEYSFKGGIGMKKRMVSILLVFCAFCMVGCLNSSSPVKWPDFIRFEDEFYISKEAEVLESDIDDKVGMIESKSPRRTCKWVPVNNEAGKLSVGTDIYSLKDDSQLGIAVYQNGKYIYYEKVTEDEFYTAVSICNE